VLELDGDIRISYSRGPKPSIDAFGMFLRMDQSAVTLTYPRSQACTASQFSEPAYGHWSMRIKEPPRLHRKQWEFCFILQAAATGGVMAPGLRALGFGVGQEPLAAVFATVGMEVVATDIDAEHAEHAGWSATGQHARNVEALNNRGICPQDRFATLVSHRVVDMNNIPEDLVNFDLCWSSCALEHLGSIDQGLQFIENSLKTLRPGGLAIHTTELNISPGDETIETGHTVLYKRKHLEELANKLRDQGCEIVLDFQLGDQPEDQHVDVPPYSGDNHLKLALMGFTSTSFGLIIRRNQE
jgi:2-polyprenyl-3-methyl-5-hydroxy-6-metoxy-1,4-benzoquinol methylase